MSLSNVSQIGVTIFLCGMAIALLGSLCHAPSVMLANFIATPIELRYCPIPLKFSQSYFLFVLQSYIFMAYVKLYFFFITLIVSSFALLSLVVPFLRFGESISGGLHFPLTSDALKKVLTGQASHEVLLSIAHAVSGQFDIFNLSCSHIQKHISFSTLNLVIFRNCV